MPGLTFKQFLIEGGSGSGRPGYGDRPQKSLWFDNPYYWYADIVNHTGRGARFIDVEGSDIDMSALEGQEGMPAKVDMFAVDETGEQCHGHWKFGEKKGVTFHRPRPLKLVTKA